MLPMHTNSHSCQRSSGNGLRKSQTPHRSSLASECWTCRRQTRRRQRSALCRGGPILVANDLLELDRRPRIPGERDTSDPTGHGHRSRRGCRAAGRARGGQYICRVGSRRDRDRRARDDADATIDAYALRTGHGPRERGALVARDLGRGGSEAVDGRRRRHDRRRRRRRAGWFGAASTPRDDAEADQHPDRPRGSTHGGSPAPNLWRDVCRQWTFVGISSSRAVRWSR